MNSNKAHSASNGFALVGDIGGTNARFALWRGEVLESIEVLACADYLRPEDAVRDYLQRVGQPLSSVENVCLACAGPVGAGDFKFTNNHWVIQRDAFRTELGLSHLLLVNDSAPWPGQPRGCRKNTWCRCGPAGRWKAAPS